MLNALVFVIMRFCVLHFDLCFLAVCLLIIVLISDIIWIIYQGVIWMGGQWEEKDSSAGRSISGALGLLLSVDFKTTYTFEKITEYLNKYCNIYSYFNNRFAIYHHQDIVGGEIYDHFHFRFDNWFWKQIMLVARHSTVSSASTLISHRTQFASVIKTLSTASVCKLRRTVCLSYKDHSRRHHKVVNYFFPDFNRNRNMSTL
jgi:hypothetical protein